MPKPHWARPAAAQPEEFVEFSSSRKIIIASTRYRICCVCAQARPSFLPISPYRLKIPFLAMKWSDRSARYAFVRCGVASHPSLIAACVKALNIECLRSTASALAVESTTRHVAAWPSASASHRKCAPDADTRSRLAHIQ